jgi:hypothetical protein
MPIPLMTTYETQVIDIDLTADGQTVVLTFKPHGQPPVCVSLPRVHFERFQEKAVAALSQSPGPDSD